MFQECAVHTVGVSTRAFPKDPGGGVQLAGKKGGWTPLDSWGWGSKGSPNRLPAWTLKTDKKKPKSSWVGLF